MCRIIDQLMANRERQKASVTPILMTNREHQKASVMPLPILMTNREHQKASIMPILMANWEHQEASVMPMLMANRVKHWRNVPTLIARQRWNVSENHDRQQHHQTSNSFFLCSITSSSQAASNMSLSSSHTTQPPCLHNNHTLNLFTILVYVLVFQSSSSCLALTRNYHSVKNELENVSLLEFKLFQIIHAWQISTAGQRPAGRRKGNGQTDGHIAYPPTQCFSLPIIDGEA